MKVLFSFSVFILAQVIYSKASVLNTRNWNTNALRPVNTGIVKPKLWMWKNLFGPKNRGRAGQLKQDLATPSKFKIKGTAALKNGKLKLDLVVDNTNRKLNSPSGVLVVANAGASTTPGLPTTATTPGTGPTSGPSTAPTTGATTGVITTGAGISTTVGGPTSAPGLGLTTSQPTTASSGPSTTPLVTSGATTAPVTSGVPSGPTVGTTIATTTAGAGVPTTAVGATSGVTTAASTLAPPTALGTLSTIASSASTLPTSPVGATTMSTGAQTTSPVVVTAVTTMPTSQPSGGLLNKICITPGNVYVVIAAKEVRNVHNAYRRTHGAPDLQLDEQMICDAQKFAQKIAFDGVLKHQSSDILVRKDLGENIGMSCTPARNGPFNFDKIRKMVRSVTKRWYDEVCEYNFDRPSYVPGTGHFTEVVWSGSKKLGVGYAVGKNAKFPGYTCVYVVGRYSPAGNNIGAQRLETNVKRGNFNDAYCRRRSKAPSFTLIPVNKRNRLKNKGH